MRVNHRHLFVHKWSLRMFFFLNQSCFLWTETRRLSSVQVKASSTDETSSAVDANELFSDLKEKVCLARAMNWMSCSYIFICTLEKMCLQLVTILQWDKVENKSTVILYGGGAIVAVWLSSIIVGAINSVPLVSNACPMNLLVQKSIAIQSRWVWFVNLIETQLLSLDLTVKLACLDD